jgi:REP element-mobilizing transposase RayT
MIDELVQGFDAAVFCDLLNEKFAGTFSPVTKPIPVDKDLPWKHAEQLGVVKTLAGPHHVNMPLVVVAAELPEGEELRERSSRVKQFKFAKKVLDASMSNASPDVEGLISQGLFVFYDDQGNFRLSLVYGKPEGTKLVWSAVRRQSFYVEAGDGNKTFRDRVELPWTSFDKLKDAFSVEKLTKEFYSRLFKWYQWALSDEMGVTYPNDTDTDEDDRQISEHIIRLITRLMFVWFLKQKHLVPDKLFDSGKLKHILKEFDPVSGDNYYRAILQNLFFATLNSQIGERRFAAGSGKERREHFDIKTLYRYPKEFAISEAEVLELFKGIPFLNGGLFECLDRGRNYYDGFSRNRNWAAKVPNRLFFDQDEGLIPLLRQYNFTVEENSPGDEEVALDPELLGKVFENLLAAYNPETNVQARKATGSFYTPREIVNYMVDESLIAYLKEKVGQTFLSAKSPKSSALQAGMPASPLSITRRRLPHWQADGAIYWITFRLADSIPQDKLQLWKRQRDDWQSAHPEPWTEEERKEYDEIFTKRMEGWLDAGMGSRALARTDVRDAVRECLLKFDGERLCVHSAVIMPTHVHCLIEPLPKVGQTFLSTKENAALSQTGMSASHSLSGILKGIKGASARAANTLLGTTGTFWMDESYDHIVRSEKQYRHFLQYIEENPTKAGLSTDEYWLYTVKQALLPADYENIVQTGMSASPSLEATIRKLFDDGERPEDDALCKQLDEALVTAKILDPACGSGAFPMGMLLRMVDALRVLRGIPEDDPVYELKLQLIENCIYGADIQCIAVQISKLRFFISLICEQKRVADFPVCDCGKDRQAGMPAPPSPENNYGIHSLPNLETKFVAANSLIGLPHDGEMLPMQDVEALKKQLWSIRHRHFLARSYQEKKELRKEDRKLRTELARALELGGGFDTASAKLMAEWDPYEQNTRASFLDAEWMFNVAAGFGVVIGNPPYGRIFSKAHEEVFSERWPAFRATKDAYVAFMLQGLDSTRKGGVECFIVPSAWLGGPGYELLRSDLLNRTVSQIISLPFDMFAAAYVDNAIILVRNAPRPEGHVSQAYAYPKKAALDGFTPGPWESIEQAEWSCISGKKIVLSSAGLALQKKLQANCQRTLRDVVEMRRGVLFNKSILKERRTGPRSFQYFDGDVYRYEINTKMGGWVTFGAGMKECPKSDKWFQGKRLLLRRLVNRRQRLMATLADADFITNKNLYSLLSKDGGPSPECLLAVVNSALMSRLYIDAVSQAAKDDFPQVTIADFLSLPLPTEIAPANEGKLADLADRILAAKKADPSADCAAIEAEIDQLVYKLYDLTPDEIAVVEESATRSAASAGRGKMKKADGKKLKKTRKRKANLPPSLPGWD